MQNQRPQGYWWVPARFRGFVPILMRVQLDRALTRLLVPKKRENDPEKKQL
jgi:hypothetical protein